MPLGVTRRQKTAAPGRLRLHRYGVRSPDGNVLASRVGISPAPGLCDRYDDRADIWDARTTRGPEAPLRFVVEPDGAECAAQRDPGASGPATKDLDHIRLCNTTARIESPLLTRAHWCVELGARSLLIV